MNYDENSLESEFQRYAEVVSKKLKEEMVDPIQAITAGKNALEGIKRLNGYAEEIKDISKRGEFMRIIGELSLQLAETQIRLAEKIQEVEKLNGEIRELNNPVFQLIFDSKLGHYYEANDSGRTKPFCTGCYDKNKKSITLTKMPSAMKELGSRKCPVCNAVYP